MWVGKKSTRAYMSANNTRVSRPSHVSSKQTRAMPPPLNTGGPSTLSPLTIDTSSSPRSPVPLYPPLGAPEDLNAFVKAGRAVSFALSPRGNGFCAYERQKDASAFTSATSAKGARVIYFAHWDKIRKEDAQVWVLCTRYPTTTKTLTDLLCSCSWSPTSPLIPSSASPLCSLKVKALCEL